MVSCFSPGTTLLIRFFQQFIAFAPKSCFLGDLTVLIVLDCHLQPFIPYSVLDTELVSIVNVYLMQPLGAHSLLFAYPLSATTVAYQSQHQRRIDETAFTCLLGDYDHLQSGRVGCGEGQGFQNVRGIKLLT